MWKKTDRYIWNKQLQKYLATPSRYKAKSMLKKIKNRLSVGNRRMNSGEINHINDP